MIKSCPEPVNELLLESTAVAMLWSVEGAIQRLRRRGFKIAVIPLHSLRRQRWIQFEARRDCTFQLNECGGVKKYAVRDDSWRLGEEYWIKCWCSRSKLHISSVTNLCRICRKRNFTFKYSNIQCVLILQDSINVGRDALCCLYILGRFVPKLNSDSLIVSEIDVLHENGSMIKMHIHVGIPLQLPHSPHSSSGSQLPSSTEHTDLFNWCVTKWTYILIFPFKCLYHNVWF